MDISEKILNKMLRILAHIQSIGKPAKYLYEVKNGLFLVRKETADKFVIDEIWKKKQYPLYIKEKVIIVDVGANIGAFSVYAAQKARNGKVFSFEPESSNYQQLLKNINLNKLNNIYPHKLGLAEKKKKMPLFLSDVTKGAHSVHGSFTKNKEIINCISLKDVFKLCKIKNIDILKMDVEGAEYDILFSTSKDIFDKIDLIIFEFHDYFGLKYNYKQLVTFLKKKGFKIDIKTPKILTKLFKQGVIIAYKNK